MQTDAPAAVSYTHLDVYKRQRLYIRRVMDGSAEMLDRLNAELAREDNQIVETEQSADNLAEVLDDLTAELKATKRQRIRDIMKHPDVYKRQPVIRCSRK